MASNLILLLEMALEAFMAMPNSLQTNNPFSVKRNPLDCPSPIKQEHYPIRLLSNPYFNWTT